MKMGNNPVLIVMAVTAAFLLSFLSYADMLPWPNFPSGQKLTYRSSYLNPADSLENKFISQKVFHLEFENKLEIVFPASTGANGFKIKGVLHLNNGGVKEELVTIKNHGGKIYWTGLTTSLMDKDGRVVRSGVYNLADSSQGFLQDAYMNDSLLFLCMGLPPKPGHEQQVILWISPLQQMIINIKVAAIEEITTPAGTFKCFRVEIVPIASDYFGWVVGNIIRPILTPYKIWYQVENPHIPVKYMGYMMPSANPGQPQTVRELVSVE